MEYIATHPLPPLPDWATGPYAHYSCCRSTFATNPNSAFIEQLTKIKDARQLRLDDVGVRAYSTSIASVSAYPYRIEHAEEILRLPGCEQKIASLWREWQDSAPTDTERHIQEVEELDSEPDLQVLRLFWNIWGVGAETARRFYYEHGWRDLDDIVEFGWGQLTRVQQIGLKYWDDFQEKIPRPEVESICDVILRHARLVLHIPEEKFGSKDDVECVIVGGYRRGKALCGDVDVVVTHRDENKTKDLVGEVVCSLEDAGYITHTLTLHTTTSDRGQATLPFRAQGHRGHGFDSLDKALCVWQDPVFDEGDAGDDAGAKGRGESGSESHENAPPPRNTKKNPNIHRRVDIIISSWRTVGCAVLGWSGGTTFQRDIRRFVSKVHGLKFDSSGVRNRGNGQVLDLEGPRPRLGSKSSPGLSREAKDTEDKDKEIIESLMEGKTIDKTDERWKGMEWDDEDTWWDRERRLMEGLGIGYRPPEERCTG
jgi:DNA polymerase IV